MPTSTYESLVTRHVNRLLSHPDIAGRAGQVLELSDFEQTAGKVRKRGGEQLTADDCHRYKQSVRQVFGDAVYSSAKINFILGGCDCSDCKP